MTPKEIQAIHDLLMDRVQPRTVREGVNIAQLAAKLVSHFAQRAAAQQDSQQQRNPPTDT